MLSVVIPAANDPYLARTINSLLKNAQGEMEIIPVLDGFTLPQRWKRDKRIKPVRLDWNQGMRAAINAGIFKARGKYIMKSDSHCIFGPGFDTIMTKNCHDNWLMIPRRYSIDEANWRRDETRPVRDYHYLTFPGLWAHDWVRHISETNNPDRLIDSTMTFQGSCWLANRKYLAKRVGFLDDRPTAYGQFGGEQVEVGLKYWLGGGEVRVIKSTWYAHLSKRPHHYRMGTYTRRYKGSRATAARRSWLAHHWLHNEEPGMIHPLSWLVEKFWPVPEWPENRLKWSG